jgi:hypothetical protein
MPDVKVDDSDVFIVANRFSQKELRDIITKTEDIKYAADYWAGTEYESPGDVSFWNWYLDVCRESLSWKKANKPSSQPLHNGIDAQKVKEKTDIVSVIEGYTKLRKSGSRYYGVCPIHKDKHPSMAVYSSQQTWHCFGCGRCGDVFDFVQAVENVDFKEALRRLS